MAEAAISVKDQIEQYVDNYKLFARDCIKIRDHHTAKVVPLIFNRGQEILHKVTERQKADKGFVRILFLKSRRFGGSTYVEGRFYWLSSLNYNRNAFIVGHEKESTNTLFEMAKLMQEQNPIPPAELKNNEKSLKFDTKDGKGLKSEYRLATADNVDAGRSQGVHYLHGSEEAFWRDGRTLLTGLVQCVPDPPAESEILRESTANGYGNSFQEDVSESYCEGKYPYHIEDGITFAWINPETDWILVFVPWFVHERYTKPFDSSAKKQGFQAEINKKVFNEADMQWEKSISLKLKEKYSLTLEQLHWRQWAIRNKCRGSDDIFCQEYPSNVEEAFLSAGSNIFGKELCDQVEEGCEKPIIVGDVVDRMGKSRIRANQYGKFKLWEKPDQREVYFLTVDSAGGKRRNVEKDAKARKPDFTVVDVWNHRTGVQAAQWQGHIEYDLIGDLSMMIGRMFFYARACIELMNHGYTVVADLKRADYPQYEHRPGEYGWPTTGSGALRKEVMIDRLYQQSRDGILQIRCKETVSEMRTFEEDNGHLEAATGCKDDRVMSAAMATMMMTMLPKTFHVKRGDKPPFEGFKNWQRRIKDKPEVGYQEYYA